MSYTVSTSWIILFPYALRYSFLSLCILHLQSFFQDIDACIHIPVMDHVTFWALPDTNTQIFYQRILAATAAAGLAARIHRWYSADLISIPDCLIFQHDIQPVIWQAVKLLVGHMPHIFFFAYISDVSHNHTADIFFSAVFCNPSGHFVEIILHCILLFPVKSLDMFR